MITCEFFGGLGNNLFQLATVYNISKKYGFELRIPSNTERNGIQNYGQSHILELNELFENKFVYDDSLRLSLERYAHPDFNLGITDYTVRPIPVRDNLSYWGYFQSEYYFSDVNINKEFILNSEKIQYLKERYKNFFNKKNISLHYRLGGDRVSSTMQYYHQNVSLDYYLKAMQNITDYDEEKYNILVFSDNIKLTLDLLQNFPYKFEIIDNHNDNVLDFILMSMCDVNIVGNSTFSWWSAYMNLNEEKTVIATKTEWFGPGYKHYNLTDTFPKTWITL